VRTSRLDDSRRTPSANISSQDRRPGVEAGPSRSMGVIRKADVIFIETNFRNFTKAVALQRGPGFPVRRGIVTWETGMAIFSVRSTKCLQETPSSSHSRYSTSGGAAASLIIHFHSRLLPGPPELRPFPRPSTLLPGSRSANATTAHGFPPRHWTAPFWISYRRCSTRNLSPSDSFMIRYRSLRRRRPAPSLSPPPVLRDDHVAVFRPTQGCRSNGS